MPVTLERSSDRTRVGLCGAIRLEEAGELQRILMAAVADGKDIELDLACTTEMDITGIQLLWAAKLEAELAGQRLLVVGGVPPALGRAVREAGFDGIPGEAVEEQPCQKAL